MASKNEKYKLSARNNYAEVIQSLSKENLSDFKVAFFYEIDMTSISQIKENLKKEKKVRGVYSAFIIKAIALALKEFPYANRRFVRYSWLPFFGSRLQEFRDIDIAVLAERNIEGAEMAAFVDIIHNADRLSITEIDRFLLLLAEADMETNAQWRSFNTIIKYCPNWLAKFIIKMPFYIPSLWIKYRGGAAMISSPSKYGVEVVSASWLWPVSISFGLVKERPLVKDNSIVACPTSVLTMSFDRRVMAGAQAARFFKRIVDILENFPDEH